MNMHVDSSYVARLHAAHLARQQRLWYPHLKAHPVIRDETPDAHVTAYREWRMAAAFRAAEEANRLERTARARRPMTAIAAEILAGTGFTLADLRGRRRNSEIVALRRKALIAVADEWPELSSTRLGSFFHRDHTAILHLLGRTRRAKEQASRQCKPRLTRKVVYHGREWYLADLAESVGMNRRILAQRINKHGWSVERAVTTPVEQRPRKCTHPNRARET